MANIINSKKSKKIEASLAEIDKLFDVTENLNTQNIQPIISSARSKTKRKVKVETVKLEQEVNSLFGLDNNDNNINNNRTNEIHINLINGSGANNKENFEPIHIKKELEQTNKVEPIKSENAINKRTMVKIENSNGQNFQVRNNNNDINSTNNIKRIKTETSNSTNDKHISKKHVFKSVTNPSAKLENELIEFAIAKYNDKIKNEQQTISIPDDQNTGFSIETLHGLAVSDHQTEKRHYEGYWENRIAKLSQQKPLLDIYQHIDTFHNNGPQTNQTNNINNNNNSLEADITTSSVVEYPQIFSGLTFYIDGRTVENINDYSDNSNNNNTDELSHYHLSSIIAGHGGRVLPMLSRSSTAYVICNNLTFSKNKEEYYRLYQSKRNTHIKHVKPKFIKDCINAGKLLPEYPYLLIKNSDNHNIKQYYNPQQTTNNHQSNFVDLSN